MLFTKETDYAIRIIRALHDGKKRTIAEICEMENIPKAFAYKVIKKLDKAGYVGCIRGCTGGYYLRKSPENITLYDVVVIIEPDFAVMNCIYNDCTKKEGDNACRVHIELTRIQEGVKDLLSQNSLLKILQNK